MSALTTRRQDAIRGAAMEMMVPPGARELFSRHPGLGTWRCGPTSSAPPGPAGRPRLGEFEQAGVPYARPLLDAQLWADEPEPSGRRQFGRTHDVVFFPSRGTVVR